MSLFRLKANIIKAYRILKRHHVYEHTFLNVELSLSNLAGDQARISIDKCMSVPALYRRPAVGDNGQWTMDSGRCLSGRRGLSERHG